MANLSHQADEEIRNDCCHIATVMLRVTEQRYGGYYFDKMEHLAY